MKGTVLLVEDSKFIRAMVGRILLKGGYSVEMALDGDQAVQVSRDRLPQAILLDMMLPKITGDRVLRMLKEDPLTWPIPVIVITSLSTSNEQRLREDGAAGFFEKSTLEQESAGDTLVQLVDRVIHRSRAS